MNDKILDVTKDVKWIGVMDYDLVTFDVVMETKFGTTYNSYFINADKKTIVETTKGKLLGRIPGKDRAGVPSGGD
jgi:NADH oxidase (H2O-forming)